MHRFFSKMVDPGEPDRPSNRVPLRRDVPVEETWDLTSIFATADDWETAYRQLSEQLPELSQPAGKLAESGASLLAFMRLYEKLGIEMGKIYVYAHLRSDEDTADSAAAAQELRAQSLYVSFGSATAYVEPELAAISPARWEELKQDAPELGIYDHLFQDLKRNQPHILSVAEETLLARSGEVLSGAENTFSKLNDADLKFPEITGEDGRPIEITHSRYGKLLESKQRPVRRAAFEGLYSQYQAFRNTLASTLDTAVKTHNFLAGVRHFPSARARALFRNNIPEAVYDNLVASVGRQLPLLHRYVGLRKRVLELEEIYPYDLYTSLIGEADFQISFEQAREVTLAALAPLGETYGEILQRAFSERWIDRAENQGKRSGAYSSGTYGTNPYILLNWQGTLDDLYTLVHELGHSVHSYFSRATQPYHYADYSIFLAEIASTANENLLTAHLLATEKNNETLRLQVVNHFLDGVKGTVFRQTQFAEFEQFIHNANQEGTALTADFLTTAYTGLNSRYYGPDLAECAEIGLEWSRIPHFYYDFYVYQYATGFAASTAFAEQILSEGQPAVDRYLGFLKAGSSAWPIDVLKTAGLDMTKPEPIEATLNLFGRRLDELEQLLLK